jgi:hypothetical protein
MAIKFDTIKVGDVLYDCHKTLMGNTKIRRMGCWSVKVLEIRPDNTGAMCSWNGNRATFYSRRSLERLRRTPVKEIPLLW